jgi:hypothetical protein
LSLAQWPLADCVASVLRQNCSEEAVHLGPCSDTHFTQIFVKAPFNGIVLPAEAVAGQGSCRQPRSEGVEDSSGVADGLTD